MLFDRRTLLLTGAALAGCRLLAAHEVLASTPPAGAVATLEGEVTADLSGRKRPLAPGADVFVKDLVATGAAGRVALQLGKSTMIRLGSGARLRIDRHLVDAGGEYNLAAGALHFDREEGAPRAAQGFTVKSPYGLIAVRGTRFFAGPSKGVFGIFVERGSVAVAGGGKRVELKAGQGTDIARPGGRPTNPAEWKQPRIDEALASVLVTAR